MSQSPDDLLKEAILLQKQGKLKESKQKFQELANTDSPLAVEGYFGVGVIEMQSKNIDAAREAFGRVLGFEPGHPGAYLSLARMAEAGIYGPYEVLRYDSSPEARESLILMYKLSYIKDRHPPLSAYLSLLLPWIFQICVAVVSIIIMLFIVLVALSEFFSTNLGLSVIVIIMVGVLFVFAGIAAYKAIICYLRVITTTYTVAEGRIQVRWGILGRSSKGYDFLLIHPIITLNRTLLNRLTGGNGTLVLDVDREKKHIQIIGLARGEELDKVHSMLQSLSRSLRNIQKLKGLIPT
jgi:hypothetical protein